MPASVLSAGRDRATSPSWWLLAALIGPLTGVAFISAVNAYSEVSAGSGAGCAIACTPLIGIWGPMLGAYEIASVFLLPFVAIRRARRRRVHARAGAVARSRARA